MTNATISGNTAANNGGGIFNGNGTVETVNTIIAGNTAATGVDCSGTLNSLGSNLIGDETDCDFVSTTGDQVGTSASPIDPLLGPLQDNGGPTFTQELLLGSPAIDAGDNPACPPEDQRGVVRPQGPDCDIGSFERE